MQSSQELELKIKDLILALMAVLHENGIREVHMGGMMRLLGVDEEVAKDYDHERIQLGNAFPEVVREFEAQQLPPAGRHGQARRWAPRGFPGR
jgi:hypothetical protein